MTLILLMMSLTLSLMANFIACEEALPTMHNISTLEVVEASHLAEDSHNVETSASAEASRNEAAMHHLVEAVAIKEMLDDGMCRFFKILLNIH